MTDHPTPEPVPTHIAKLIRCVFGWNDARKALIGADGMQAAAASRELRCRCRDLADAADHAERRGYRP